MSLDSILIVLGIYELAGLFIGLYFLGASKVSNRWSAKVCWEQLTMEGIKGIVFWVGLFQIAIPVIIFLFLRSLWYVFTGRDKYTGLPRLKNKPF